MGQNQNSVVVLWIRVKFWWMIPMGVKYNHTKFEQETQRWRPGTGFASGQKQPFLGQKSPGTHSKRPNEEKRWVHSTCGLTSPCQQLFATL